MLFDLCVVGAGMFGSAAARHASANPSMKVILIGPSEPSAEEHKDREIFSCHYDEGRITRVLDEHFVYQKLAKHSILRYKELEKLSGIKFYNPVGFLAIGEKNSTFQVQLHKEVAVGNVPILALSHEQIKVRYPYLKCKSAEVAYLDENGAGYISARNMVKAQKEVAKMQGCTVLDDIVSKVSNQLQTKEFGFFHEIWTEKGLVIRAKRVLVCAGAFTKFKELLPHENSWRVCYSTTKEMVALLKVPLEEAERLRSMPSIVYYGTDASEIPDELNAYILPPIKYPDGNYYVKIGHIEDSGIELRTLREIQAWYHSKGDEHFIERYSKKLKDMIPSLHVQEVTSATCVTCYTPTNVPYIDRVTPTLTVAICGNGKGAKFSDEVGRIAAELSVYGKWDSEIPKSLFEIVWQK